MRHHLIILLLLLLCFCTRGLAQTDTLQLFWYTSKPFIYENNHGQLTGIEYDMMNAFCEYMKETHEKDIFLQWNKADQFGHILDVMRAKDIENAIGVSALSVTDSRATYADFSTSYFPEISVLISSKNTPIVHSERDMDSLLDKLSAVTIRDTKYVQFLDSLKHQTNASFKTEYIESGANILEVIRRDSNKFGFIDLPIYLMLVKEGGEVTRQNFFTQQGRGYAFIMPQNSIWKPYLDGFIESPKYQMINAGIFGDYLGKELFSFFENLGSEIGTSILTKEKELQVQLLKNINLRLEQQQTLSNILIISSIIVFLLLVFILYLYIRNQKTTTLLLEQNRQIEQQKEDIRQKNEQLINRNAQLVTLNEEKNNLIRILAHDIRAPLGQIIMVADLVAQKMGPNLSEVETKMLTQVTANAERINQMVEKILDVDGIEEDKVKVLNERVDIRGVMKDVAHRYRPIAAKKNIAIDLQLCDNHYIIRTDHLLLLLVLENLVSNAVKFSQPNTKVTLGADCAYDHVIFRVSDQGPGFTEEDKKKVFQRFQKLSAKPTAGESSTGLGLSIVKKYVSDLGGSVWLESEEGKGSTFYVKLEA